MTLLLALVAVYRQPDTVDHLFQYRPPQSAKSVYLAGVFNGWNKSATPMALDPDGRTWTVHVRLPYGRTMYKFVVDDTWTLDPSVQATPDGEGNTNSVIVVLPSDYDRPASPSDGIIAKSALEHTPQIPDLNFDRGRLWFRFRARANDLASVDLKVNGKLLPMATLTQNDLYQFFQISIPWDRKHDLVYNFELHDGPVVEQFGADGLGPTASPFKLVASQYKPFTVPDWVEKSVIYQIFPDRFANGDPSNDPKNVQPWGAKPTYSNRFGGDVAGVKSHIDYLRDLGIGAVYFNPVFDSPSNHRYDATDYLKIAPDFGANDEFDSLAKQMKADGIGTVMDFAFNHTAINFFAFQDIRDRGKESAYTNWYWIKSYPVVPRENPPYVAWDNYASMPKLNVMNPDTHRYLLGVIDYWQQHASLAGIRLDVANEVDPKFWQDLRSHLKAYSPSTWIVGEEWGDASPWLKGNQWDSTMGYQFRDAALHFFAEGSTTPSEFMDRLMAVYSSYVPQVSRNLMNLLDSHDTPRFLTSCNGNKNLLELAAAVEFTWPGAPTIYYGDELGMEGGKDPDNRQCMDWSLKNPANPILAYYKTLVHIRKTVPAIQSGDPVVLFTDNPNRSFAFARVLDSDLAVTVVNASETEREIAVPLPQPLNDIARRAGLKDVLNRSSAVLSDGKVTVHLRPHTAAILIPRG